MSAIYIASVIIAINVKDPLGVSWYAFAAFVAAATGAIFVYYRVTR